MDTSREFTISKKDISNAATRVCDALIEHHIHILSLDQAMGDGDLGITVFKIGTGLKIYFQNSTQEDLGKLIAGAGMEANRLAPSTMGTLLATAMMQMGREMMGKTSLALADLTQLFQTAGRSMQERGKAKLGDKTVLDVIIPAAEAFEEALNLGYELEEVCKKTIQAAEDGRDKVTPLQSQIGRASWLGERTAGLVDGGCETMMIILRAMMNG